MSLHEEPMTLYDEDTAGVPIQINTVEGWLNKVKFSEDPSYVPSKFAIDFINFIKLVAGSGAGEEHSTPLVHYKMLDQVPGKTQNIANLCSRGLAKTTIMGEYMFLYIAVYGGIPGFGDVDYALYVSDSMENGVKKMRLRLQRQWDNSEFLQKYIPTARFTDVRWYFKNVAGKEFVVTGHGAKTGVRGTVELGTRPHLAILDDLISDEDARSPTIRASVEDTVDKAIDYALHPTKRKTIWSGTPFNASDPLYKAIESGAWNVNVFPVCEQFPVARKDFKGAWPSRFNYDFVANQHRKARLGGKLDAFNQELMLRIYSQDSRLIPESSIVWKSTKKMLSKKDNLNFYITTDFATTVNSHSDYAVISVWAATPDKEVIYVDGILVKQELSQTVEDLFKFVEKYKPLQVGIETSGQQKGFISYIESEMRHRFMHFNIVEVNPQRGEGKFARILMVQPMFKFKQIAFSKELKDSPMLVEGMGEIEMITKEKIVARHDDFIDTVSQLPYLDIRHPSSENEMKETMEILGDVPDGVEDINSYYF